MPSQLRSLRGALLALSLTLAMGFAAVEAGVNPQRNCPAKVTWVAAVYIKKDGVVRGSFTIANGATPLSVQRQPIVAVVAEVPAGSKWTPPQEDGAMYGKVRLFRAYDGPATPQRSILEYPVPNCIAAPPAATKPGSLPAGKTLSCAFQTPVAVVAGADPRKVNVSVSIAVEGAGGADGSCEADVAPGKLIVL